MSASSKNDRLVAREVRPGLNRRCSPSAFKGRHGPIAGHPPTRPLSSGQRTATPRHQLQPQTTRGRNLDLCGRRRGLPTRTFLQLARRQHAMKPRDRCVMSCPTRTSASVGPSSRSTQGKKGQVLWNGAPFGSVRSPRKQWGQLHGIVQIGRNLTVARSSFTTEKD